MGGESTGNPWSIAQNENNAEVRPYHDIIMVDHYNP